MANIFGSPPISGYQGIRLASKKGFHASASTASKVSTMDDRSIVNKLAAKLRNDAPVRTDLVQRIRSEISAGTYETPERIDETIDKLIEELFPELF